jgi:hypothetical protein
MEAPGVIGVHGSSAEHLVVTGNRNDRALGTAEEAQYVRVRGTDGHRSQALPT